MILRYVFKTVVLYYFPYSSMEGLKSSSSTMQVSFVCQRCSQPLKLDTSFNVLDRMTIQELTGMTITTYYTTLLLDHVSQSAPWVKNQGILTLCCTQGHSNVVVVVLVGGSFQVMWPLKSHTTHTHQLTFWSTLVAFLGTYHDSNTLYHITI